MASKYQIPNKNGIGDIYSSPGVKRAPSGARWSHDAENGPDCLNYFIWQMADFMLFKFKLLFFKSNSGHKASSFAQWLES